ncbi:MAG TPA: sigma-70 family RNA polymerase sigma factor [Candidatus Acidoferrum sp.]|nr:sigma-70 family RNA polymerase sigma factor [Candidatus Acidoferrum sp.]
MRQSDSEVIRRVLGGDRAAFDVLVLEYQERIYRLAYRLTRNPEDARDLAQEAFVQAYRSLGSFQQRSSFSTWLYRIAMNLCLNHLKSLGRMVPAGVDGSLPDHRQNSLEAILTDERERALAAAIETLPPQQKATLTLRVHQGLSHREIAEVLECSEGTAKANYFHAVRGLQRKLQAFRDPE